MVLGVSREQVIELFRYYRTAIINTVFGVAAYSLCIWLGLNIFLAQIVSYIMGMMFNYFTYSRLVFRSSVPSKGYFILSYGLNYLIGLGILAVLARFIASPYVIGVITSLLVSIVNYFGLKHVVFRARPA